MTTPGRNGTTPRSSLFPFVQTKGVWRGRGTVKVRWRQTVNAVSPCFARIHRRNPVDHKVVRIRRLEVWW